MLPHSLDHLSVLRILALAAYLPAALSLFAGYEVLGLTLRHVFHHGAGQPGPRARRLDITADRVSMANAAGQYGPFAIKTTPVKIERPAVRMYDAQIPMSPIWVAEDIPGPDIEDKETVVNFAYMSEDAYKAGRDDPEWLDVDDQYNSSIPFGWDDSGIRGHVFSDDTNSTIILSVKGTTVAMFEGNGTSGHDKDNDNLLGSCCCGQGGSYLWRKVCDCQTGTYSCDQTCVKNELKKPNRYYAATLELYEEVLKLYPEANIITAGHSLGGVLASLIGLQHGVPSVTFETYPQALAAKRLGLPAAGDITPLRRNTGGFHFGHTADPVYMGTCSGSSSFCSIGGYAFETLCHTGKRCAYDTVKDLGWRQSTSTHRLRYAIDNVYKAYDKAATCVDEDVDCVDCYLWKFENGTHSKPSTTTTTSEATSTYSRTRTETCKTPGCVKQHRPFASPPPAIRPVIMLDYEFHVTTSRLTISYFNPDDDRHCAFVYALHNTPDMVTLLQNTPLKVPDLVAAKAWIVQTNTSLAEKGYGKYLVSRASETLDNTKDQPFSKAIHAYTLIGVVALQVARYPSSPKVPDIGYSILPEHQGNNFATEAAQGLIDYYRKCKRVTSFTGFCDLDNEKSKKVMRKLEFVELGVRDVNGVRGDGVLHRYAVFASGWTGEIEDSLPNPAVTEHEITDDMITVFETGKRRANQMNSGKWLPSPSADSRFVRASCIAQKRKSLILYWLRALTSITSPALIPWHIMCLSNLKACTINIEVERCSHFNFAVPASAAVHDATCHIERLVAQVSIESLHSSWPGRDISQYLPTVIDKTPSLRHLSLQLSRTVRHRSCKINTGRAYDFVLCGITSRLVETFISDTCDVEPSAVRHCHEDFFVDILPLRSLDGFPKLHRIVAPQEAFIMVDSGLWSLSGIKCVSPTKLLPESTENVEIIDSTTALNSWSGQLLNVYQTSPGSGVSDLPFLKNITLWCDRWYPSLVPDYRVDRLGASDQYHYHMSGLGGSESASIEDGRYSEHPGCQVISPERLGMATMEQMRTGVKLKLNMALNKVSQLQADVSFMGDKLLEASTKKKDDIWGSLGNAGICVLKGIDACGWRR
ncbi:hypothetical protein DE146DRAFT_674681 [Phaeosphaeria sp. MPI-PUGE-AT-0046c]|nr:hypothetical protein DE146DRAFT_674681 [Phaeosphaeria sp. MPI-PUGE-AT-0046c]